jgi:hypothetical protein
MMREKSVCQKCGKAGSGDDKFCEHCGGKLAALKPAKAAISADAQQSDQELAVPAEENKRFGKSRAWVIFLILVWAAAVFLRFYDLGNKPLHHDESIHAMGSYDLFHKFTYKYNPGYHGPLLYYLTSASFYLFGVSDASSRFPCGVFGLLLV